MQVVMATVRLYNSPCRHCGEINKKRYTCVCVGGYIYVEVFVGTGTTIFARLDAAPRIVAALE